MSVTPLDTTTSGSVGTRIARLREDHGWSQAQLAKRVAVHKQTIWKWENDEAEPRGRNLDGLSRVLGVTPAQLLGGEVLQVREQRASYGETDIHARLDEILGSELAPDEKSSLLVDLALTLRAAALHERSEALRIDAQTAHLEAQAAIAREQQRAGAPYVAGVPARQPARKERKRA